MKEVDISMLYIIDTANVDQIRRCNEFFPIAGVTTNPTIISKEKRDFVELIKEIRSIIGPDKMLHVQTTQEKCSDIIAEAEALRDIAGDNFYVKIPIGPEGLKATMALAKRDINVTVTAIFTQQQAMLAASAGAKFVAPYVNRLDNLLSDGIHVVEEIEEMFRTNHVETKVLAASFKTIEQVHKIAMVGGDAVTINPELFDHLIYHPLTQYAIDDFNCDWKSVYGDKKILDFINEYEGKQ